jgi:hypothetical protein
VAAHRPNSLVVEKGFGNYFKAYSNRSCVIIYLSQVERRGDVEG